MLYYKLYLKNPASHYIYVDLEIDQINTEEIQLQLPAWRPGRYELGNFAKNLKRLDAFDEGGSPLEYLKITKDLWEIKTNGNKKIKVTYSYFANELNAGACYADANQIYVNPVHLCLYIPNRMNEEHKMEVIVPENYKFATSLPITKNCMLANSFDELADSPFFASATIHSDVYEVNGIKFHLHFNGECRPDFTKIKTHFSAFTKKQIEFWGAFPVNEYHFLFQVLPYKFYHGVEHEKNTVIALGPGYDLNNGKTYEDMLGVSSHELFHTWNIKNIRPIEMLPYDFTKENYARTGFVYEGFTTYYGDLILRSSGVFNDEQYFQTLEERLVKHFHNYGRFNLSVAHSSWETWLDGYVPGSPYRKTSIYDEGNLVAFMLDVLIIKNSKHKKSLRDVCRNLFIKYGKNKTGYTESNIVELCEAAAEIPLTDFFTKYVYGTENFEPLLNDCFDYLGLELNKKSTCLNENVFGFKITEVAGITKVTAIAPYSPAWRADLGVGDEVIALNGHIIKNDLNSWLTYYKGKNIELHFSSQNILKSSQLEAKLEAPFYYENYKIVFKTGRTKEQQINFLKWAE